MRSTMREDSVKRKPTRAMSRTKRPFQGSQNRQDSLSPAREPMTRTPSPHDAALAAQAAQLRIHTPSPIASTGQNPYRWPSPPNLPSTSTAADMRNNLAKTPYGRQPVAHEPQESIPLQHFRSTRSGTLRNTSSPAATRSSAGSSKRKLANKLTGGLAGAFGDYVEVWQDRNAHVSDEHLALRAIKNFVRQRREKKRIGSPTPHGNFHNSLPYASRSGTVAWPSGAGRPLERAPTPLSFAGPSQFQLSPPEPAFTRDRERCLSGMTAKTGMTTWSGMQRSLEPDNVASLAAALASKGQAKGKSRKAGLSIHTADLPYSHSRPKPTIIASDEHIIKPHFRALNNDPTAGPDLITPQNGSSSKPWNPEEHVFDPNRDSYQSDPAARRYRAHTAASSIYSQPGAIEEPRFDRFPPPPPIPGEYLQHADAKNGHRPVSPLTVDMPVSAFLSSRPGTSGSNRNRRVAGDWTDSFYGGKSTEHEGKISHAHTEAKTRPTPRDEGSGNQARGTQFYDFYRDSGVVFQGSR